MKILIYVNGGEGIGLGHTVRMVFIASKLRDIGVTVDFCSLDVSIYQSGHKLVLDNGFNLFLLQQFKDISSHKADCIIVDNIVEKYGLCSEDLSFLRKHFMKVVCIDDECELDFYDVDIIVNTNPYAKLFHYNVLKDTKFVFDFVFLRDEFFEVPKISINKNIKNIFLTLGGSDDNNFTLQIIDALKDYLIINNVVLHVAIGPAFRYKQELLASAIYNIKFYENANMSYLMSKADVGITGCGQSVYEFLTIGVPSLGFVLSSNQENIPVLADKYGYLKITNIFQILSDIEKMTYQNRLDMRKNIDKYFKSSKFNALEFYKVISGA